MTRSSYRRAVAIRTPMVIGKPTGRRPLAVMRVGMGAVLLPPVSASISSLFGPRSTPVAGASSDHKGIDYSVPIGTPVSAAGAGVVSFAGVQSGFGNVVYIDHGDGTTTIYGHLSQISVSPGQAVSAGDVVGLSGATGTVTGPNLHFEVRVDGSAVDPLSEFSLADLVPNIQTSGSSLDPATAGLAAAVAGVVLYAIFG